MPSQHYSMLQGSSYCELMAFASSLLPPRRLPRRSTPGKTQRPKQASTTSSVKKPNVSNNKLPIDHLSLHHNAKISNPTAKPKLV